MSPEQQQDTVRRVLELAEMNRQWAKWAKALGYPFDFTNPDAIPPNDLLDAIANEWFRDENGGWPSFREAQWHVYEEVYGTDAALAALGEPPREVVDASGTLG